jgi:hypothetical protein
MFRFAAVELAVMASVVGWALNSGSRFHDRLNEFLDADSGQVGHGAYAVFRVGVERASAGTPRGGKRL